MTILQLLARGALEMRRAVVEALRDSPDIPDDALDAVEEQAARNFFRAKISNIRIDDEEAAERQLNAYITSMPAISLVLEDLESLDNNELVCQAAQSGDNVRSILASALLAERRGARPTQEAQSAVTEA